MKRTAFILMSLLLIGCDDPNHLYNPYPLNKKIVKDVEGAYYILRANTTGGNGTYYVDRLTNVVFAPFPAEKGN